MNQRRSIPMIIVILVLLSLVLTSSSVLAQSGSSGVTIPYSGRLTDEVGQPVADGKYDVQFALYDAEVGGQLLWSETQSGITVQSGALDVSLGAAVPMSTDVSERKELWLSISVRGPNEVDFTLLNPRQSFNGPAAVSALTCPHSHFTDYWSGTSTVYGLDVVNSGTGDAIRAYSKSTNNSYAAIWAVNNATTGSGTAVYANSSRGIGVYANSPLNDAIDATTNAANKSAVFAHSGPGYGVTGRSTSNFGVQAGGGGDASGSDFLGDLYLEGVRGEMFTGGTVLNLFSNGWISFDLDNDNNGSHKLEVWNGANSLVFTVDESGNTVATGVKSAKVQTADYGQRLLYAVESPEVWLEDFGSAKLDNGTTTVKFEPIFAETANLNEDYHVFLTPLGDCALYVAEKTPASFTVKAIGGQTCSIAFDYRLAAKRLGYEMTRLAPVNLTDNSKQVEVR